MVIWKVFREEVETRPILSVLGVFVLVIRSGAIYSKFINFINADLGIPLVRYILYVAFIATGFVIGWLASVAVNSRYLLKLIFILIASGSLAILIVMVVEAFGLGFTINSNSKYSRFYLDGSILAHASMWAALLLNEKKDLYFEYDKQGQIMGRRKGSVARVFGLVIIFLISVATYVGVLFYLVRHA
ncbi:MAG: hypothetical protein HC850_02810 [Rhodomicrobium sp.]|nr:hypothetical protein [Rhodomicrobium sp.]